MGSQDYLAAKFLLDRGLQLVELNRALCSLHGHLDTRAQVKHFDRSIQVPGHVAEQLDSRDGQAGAVAAVSHGNQVDFIVPGELAVLLLDPLETLRTTTVFETFGRASNRPAVLICDSDYCDQAA